MASYMKNIHIINRCCGLWRAEKLEGHDIGGGQYACVYEVCRDPGISQDQLARRLFVNKSNAARQLAGLEKNGYVERRQSERDRRVVRVYPTEKMLRVLPAVRQATLEWKTYLTEGMTQDELAVLKDLLDRMAARAAEYAERALPEDNEEL